ncbi:MAG TPA: hypothetical protein VKB80_08325 [Kofleriaceae bacterium]|nr:hypothetical protein [Kofleriaceae bacterium]
MSALADRYFVVGRRPVRLREQDGGLACEVFDWNTGDFVIDNTYLSVVISGYGEVDEVTREDFDAAVERLRAERAPG